MADPTPAEALSTLEEAHLAVGILLSELTDEEAMRPATIGGGEWSARDLLGHLAAWEHLALEALGQWRAGRRPRVEDLFGQPDGVDRFNAEAVASARTVSLEETRHNAARTHEALVSAIEGMAPEEWEGRAPYEAERRRRLAGLLGSVLGAPRRPFGHAFAHLPDLEAYVRSLD